MSETASKSRTTHDTILKVYEDVVLSNFKEDVKGILAAPASTIKSREDLRLSFNRVHGCDISPSVFADWLEKAGVSFERAVSVKVV